MSRPIKEYKFKGLKLAKWSAERFSIDKSYFKKAGDAGEWVKTNSYFKNELEELAKLIQQALRDDDDVQPVQKKSLLDSLPPVQDFNDDDIPF